MVLRPYTFLVGTSNIIQNTVRFKRPIMFFYMLVFLKLIRSSIAILEIGFGTGLNALITFLEARKRNKKVHYVGVEAYPISSDEVQKLNYVSELNANSRSN